jgi:hypothetical protein
MTGIMPSPNHLVSSRLGYFIRPGRHDMTVTEWEVWMEFCDKHLPEGKELIYQLNRIKVIFAII